MLFTFPSFSFFLSSSRIHKLSSSQLLVIYLCIIFFSSLFVFLLFSPLPWRDINSCFYSSLFTFCVFLSHTAYVSTFSLFFFFSSFRMMGFFLSITVIHPSSFLPRIIRWVVLELQVEEFHLDYFFLYVRLLLFSQVSVNKDNDVTAVANLQEIPLCVTRRFVE